MKQILINLSYNEYEKEVTLVENGKSRSLKFKEWFTLFRKSENISYRFDKKKETPDFIHMEWKGIRDELFVDYIKDKEKSSATNFVITKVIITYNFSEDSSFYAVFINVLYQILNHVPLPDSHKKEDIPIPIEIERSSQNIKEAIKKSFLSEMEVAIGNKLKTFKRNYPTVLFIIKANVVYDNRTGVFKETLDFEYPYSPSFISKTVQLIEEGSYKGMKICLID